MIQQSAAVIRFIRAGLKGGEKGFYIAPENTAAKVLDAMSTPSTCVDPHNVAGARSELPTRPSIGERIISSRTCPFFARSFADFFGVGLFLLDNVIWFIHDGSPLLEIFPTRF
ncbi:MAG: hypothetical protein DMG26_01075 [Acidobacteria bacterium]|nr:MAG: hypothetical protein DMG26_01075 [Acidobacteriota bacterium]